MTPFERRYALDLRRRFNKCHQCSRWIQKHAPTPYCDRCLSKLPENIRRNLFDRNERIYVPTFFFAEKMFHRMENNPQRWFPDC